MGQRLAGLPGRFDAEMRIWEKITQTQIGALFQIERIITTIHLRRHFLDAGEDAMKWSKSHQGQRLARFPGRFDAGGADVVLVNTKGNLHGYNLE